MHGSVRPSAPPGSLISHWAVAEDWAEALPTGAVGNQLRTGWLAWDGVLPVVTLMIV